MKNYLINENLLKVLKNVVSESIIPNRSVKQIIELVNMLNALPEAKPVDKEVVESDEKDK